MSVKLTNDSFNLRKPYTDSRLYTAVENMLMRLEAQKLEFDTKTVLHSNKVANSTILYGKWR